MSIGNEGEEETPTHRELAALARKRDRQDKLAGKARARAKRVRSHVAGKDLAAENLEAEKLAAKYNGKKVGVEVVFGPEGATQLVFRRLYRSCILGPDGEPQLGPDGEIQFIFRRVKGGVAGWQVGLRAGAISRYDFQRELNKSKLALWNKEKGEGSLAFKAAEQLRACFFEIEGLRKLHRLRLRLRQLLIGKLREKAKQEGVSLIEPDAAAEETLYTYPKPLVDTLRELREQLARVEGVEEQRDTQSYELIRARDAISLTFEALFKGLGGKMQIAFGKLRGDDSKWPRDIEKLKWYAVHLARDLQRPPTKAELRKSYNSTRHHANAALGESRFSPLLKHVGFWWLEKAKRVKKKGRRLKRSST